MADASIFQIEEGVLALALVDKTEAGYQDAWLAPGGATVDTVTEDDYDIGSATWKCQVTSGQLTASANDNNVDVPATFCQAARTVPQPGETSFALEFEFLQDVNVKAGLSRFLFEYDTDEAYFLLGLSGDDPPKAIGRVRVVAGTFGGAARDNLTAQVSLALSRKPQIEFGTATDSEAVPANPGPGAASGATSGTPGAWTPAGSTPPANAAAAGSVVANPATAWTTDQYMQGSTVGASGQMYWTGSAWAAGKAT